MDGSTKDQRLEICSLELNPSNHWIHCIDNTFLVMRATGIPYEVARDMITLKTAPFLDKIPVEIRLVVYEEFLRFERPIRKRRTENAYRVSYDREKFALLYVNKQIKDEVLPILYKNNVFSVHQRDLCKPAPTSPKLDLDMICHLKISRLLHSPNGNRYFDSGEGAFDRLFDILLNGRLPKLKSALIHLGDDWHSTSRNREAMQRRGLGLEFTAVGQFRVTNLDRPVDVQFRHHALTEDWDFIASRPAHEFRSQVTPLSILGHPLLMQSSLTRRAQKTIRFLFLAYHGTYGENAEALSEYASLVSVYLDDVHPDLHPAILKPEHQRPQTFERITTILEGFM